MIFADANVLVSAIVGKHTKGVLDAAANRGLALGAPERQFAEASRVLTKKLGLAPAYVAQLLQELAQLIEPVSEERYQHMEAAARARLHARAQSDWPVLAAAMAADGSVWSHDRDFFGVGVPVWSSRNLRFAA